MLRPIIFAFAVSAFVCSSATSFAQNPSKLFSVPFFIENIFPPAPSALRADFTLQYPAILESLSLTCAGNPRGGLLLVDEGPLGSQGTTGVGTNSNVGLVVGPPAGTMVRIDFISSVVGNTYYPPTKMGLPVKSKFTFILFPNAPSGANCFGTAVFQSLN